MSVAKTLDISGTVTPAISASSPGKKVFIWVLLGGASFQPYVIIRGVSVADIFFGCAVLVSLGHFLLKGAGRFPRWSVYIALMVFWAVACMLFAANYGFFGFSIDGFLRSFSKLCFYGTGSVLLGVYLREFDDMEMGKTILNVLALNALVAIYIYLAMQLPLGLPYKFFWTGQYASEKTAYYTTYFGSFETEFIRARGVFAEPAHLGIFLTLGLAYLYFISPVDLKGRRFMHVIVIMAVIFTFSLSAYALFALILFLSALHKGRPRLLTTGMLWAVALLTVFFMVSNYPPVREAMQETVFDRLDKVYQGKDASATSRVVKSWELPLKIAGVSPVFGCGMGNLDSAAVAVGDYEYMFKGQEVQLWNIFAYVLGAMGVVGLAILVLFSLGPMLKDRYAGTVFLFSMFATGTFLAPPFWVYYVLFCHEGKKTDGLP